MNRAMMIFRCSRPLLKGQLQGPIKVNPSLWENLAIRRGMEHKNVSTIEKDPFVSDKLRRQLGIWFMSIAGASFVTVVVGGVTRLTKSGLSMVKWDFFREIPPMSEAKWLAEFEEYKQYPEYKIANCNITLEEFKKIWYMEYFHRTVGRVTGLITVVPFAYFWLTNKLGSRLIVKGLAISSLVAAQGLLGWYMVKSGLKEDIARKYGQPHVSHYRLAAHLGTAFTLFIASLANGFYYLLTPGKVPVTVAHLKFRKHLHSVAGLIFLTAISGAFVAGLDAGLVYNTWPKMADRWFPSDYWAKIPPWINITENPTATQFNHRLLAQFTVLAILGLWGYSRRIKLPPRARLACNVMAIGALGQLTLGVITLINYVPVPLASMHQAGALSLLATAVWTMHETKLLRIIPK